MSVKTAVFWNVAASHDISREELAAFAVHHGLVRVAQDA
jgi:hypothetical protein